MSDKPRWFGWNLKSLNVVLLGGGLLCFALLQLGLWLHVASWPWQTWALLGATIVGVLLLSLTTWQVARAIRRRRWKSLAIIAGVLAATFVGLLLLRNAYIPWTTIEGRVVDAETGQPMVGVQVSARLTNSPRPTPPPLFEDERMALGWLLSSGFDVQTDDEGRYRFRALPLGVYNLWATQPGRTGPAIDSLSGNRNATTQAPDLRLGAGGMIKGRIIELDTGLPIRLRNPSPISDVIVFHGPARPKSGGAVESAPIQPDGTFELRAAPGVNYLYINGTAYFSRTPAETQVSVKEGETIDIELFVQGSGLEAP